MDRPIECPKCGADVCLVYGVALHCSRSHWDTTRGVECDWILNDGGRFIEVTDLLDGIVWGRVKWFQEIGQHDAYR